MKNWYVVHTQTGVEDKVKTLLESRVASQGLTDSITKIVIPTEQVSEIRSGKKRISQRKFFPGYLIVEMDLSEKTYLLIKTTPGVTGFIGLGKRPMPLPQKEVDNILKRTEETQVKPSPKVIFEIGEQFHIGDFVDVEGWKDEVLHDFQGYVVGFKDTFIQVRDQDDNVFDCEYNQCTITKE